MTCWLFRIGRLGVARTGYQAIGGWRHLWWRFWWRVDAAAAPASTPPVDRPGPVEPEDAPPVIHLVIHPENRPLCGATIRQPWTEVPSQATCPECRATGEAISLRYWITTR